MPVLFHMSCLIRWDSDKWILDEELFRDLGIALQEARLMCLAAIYLLDKQWASFGAQEDVDGIVKYIIGGKISRQKLIDIFKKLYLKVLAPDKSLVCDGKDPASRGIDTTLDPKVIIEDIFFYEQDGAQLPFLIMQPVHASTIASLLPLNAAIESPDRATLNNVGDLDLVRKNIIAIRYHDIDNTTHTEYGPLHMTSSEIMESNVCTLRRNFFSSTADKHILTFKDIFPFLDSSIFQLGQVPALRLLQDIFHSKSSVGAREQRMPSWHVPMGYKYPKDNDFQRIENPSGEHILFACYTWDHCQLARMMADLEAKNPRKRMSDFALKNASNLRYLLVLTSLLLAYPDRQFAPQFFTYPAAGTWTHRPAAIHSDSVFKVFRNGAMNDGSPFEEMAGYNPEEDGWRQLHGDEWPTLETAIAHLEAVLDKTRPLWRNVE